jgi:hypothetical protein
LHDRLSPRRGGVKRERRALLGEGKLPRPCPVDQGQHAPRGCLGGMNEIGTRHEHELMGLGIWEAHGIAETTGDAHVPCVPLGQWRCPARAPLSAGERLGELIDVGDRSASPARRHAVDAHAPARVSSLHDLPCGGRASASKKSYKIV